MKVHEDFNGANVKNVPIDKIRIPEYQRDISDAWAKQLAAEWTSRLFRYPAVVARDDGWFDCIDGQHEIAAAAARGHTHIPCLVYSGISEAEAAATFSDLNTQRRKPEAYDTWKADYIAGRHWAVTLKDIAEKHGLSLTKGGGGNPRQLRAIGALKGYIQLRGQEDVVDDALDILTSAYPADEPFNKSRTERALIVGMIDLITRSRAFDAYDKEKFKGRLSRATYRLADARMKVTPDGFQTYLGTLVQSGQVTVSSVGSGGQHVIYGKAFAHAILGRELANKVYGLS